MGDDGNRATSLPKTMPVPERRGDDGASSSYVEVLKSKPVQSPWLHNNDNFDENVTILNADRLLPKPVLHIEDDVLCLDGTDYTAVEIGWGYCLLGFFAGRFPNKDEIKKAVLKWPHTPKISYHRNSWVVFRFKTEGDMRRIMGMKTQKVEGSPLILCPLPKDFCFDTTPEIKY